MSAYEDDGVIQWVGKYQRVELQGNRSSTPLKRGCQGFENSRSGAAPYLSLFLLWNT